MENKNEKGITKERDFESILNFDLQRVAFKSSPGVVLYQGVLRSFKIWMIALIIYVLSVWVLKVKFHGIWLFYGLLIALAVGIISICLTRVILITVTSEEVAFIRRGQSYQRFSIADEQFSTLIEQQTVNGFAFYVRRYLRIGGKLYECNNFSRTTFSEMEAYIQQMKRKKEGIIPKEQEPAARINQKESAFSIPKEDLLKKERTRTIKIALECLGVGAMLLIVWYFTLWRRDESSTGILIFTGVGIAAVFIIIPIIVEIIRLKNYRHKLPESVMLKEQFIQVDERIFAFDNITMIQMTPTTYLRSGQYFFRRKLRIFSRGKTFEYHLGDTQMKEFEYKDYASLLEEMKQLCDRCRIKFILDL